MIVAGAKPAKMRENASFFSLRRGMGWFGAEFLHNESISYFATVDETGFIAHTEGDAPLRFEGVSRGALFGADETDNPYWAQNEDAPNLTKVRIVIH
ncbi:hypothetical protein [Paenibacillus sp. CECT 9249]|uniref:hypothetical protein n=1 Tax=Paenibacillus sp. CECT 9249 TaxID=2845385 RepID=UPI001E5AD7C6|nr:hypothetical protein [Paenibacillus sp. CECT 9249]